MADTTQPSRVLHLTALCAGLLVALLCGLALWRRAPATSSVAELTSGRVAEGRVVELPGVALDTSGTVDMGQRSHVGGIPRSTSLAVLRDRPDSAERLPVLYFRDLPSLSHTEGKLLWLPPDMPWKGTLRRFEASEAERVHGQLAEQLAGRAPRFYLSDMELPGFSPTLALIGLLGLGVAAWGLAGVLRVKPVEAVQPRRRPPSGAHQRPPVVAADATSVDPRQLEHLVCPACGTTYPVQQSNCPRCKKPTSIEYIVSASPSLMDFETLVPSIVSAAQVSEYQARQPLARPHSALPYLPFEGFYEAGSDAPPHRPVARPLRSLVSAKALSAELTRRGEEALIIDTEQLAAGPFPEPALAVDFDEDQLRFELADAGGGSSEHEIAWENVALVVFSADRPLRSSVTVLQSARAGAGSAARGETSYAIDVFEAGQPLGYRIREPGHVRWDRPELRNASRAEQRLGGLMEAIERYATQARLQYISGAYRGEHTSWRMNYHSRWRFLVGEQLGWQRDEEVQGFPDYEILEVLGRGGMGAVYKARQIRLGRVVALKVISPALASSRDFVARFKQEARAAANLSHPNVVGVIDQGEHRGRHYISMEFVPGRTLKDILKQRSLLREREALQMALPVARALEHAHERGLLHRDVKPDNVFVAEDGGIKLGDWGLAKTVEDDTSLTRTGLTVGTPNYMSPEQARARRDLTPATDVYSFTAMLFHMLTGRPPFEGGSPAEVLTQHMSEAPQDPRELVPELSRACADLVLAGLAKDPTQRPTTTQLLELIERRLTELNAERAAGQRV